MHDDKAHPRVQGGRPHLHRAAFGAMLTRVGLPGNVRACALRFASVRLDVQSANLHVASCGVAARPNLCSSRALVCVCHVVGLASSPTGAFLGELVRHFRIAIRAARFSPPAHNSGGENALFLRGFCIPPGTACAFVHASSTSCSLCRRSRPGTTLSAGRQC